MMTNFLCRNANLPYKGVPIQHFNQDNSATGIEAISMKRIETAFGAEGAGTSILRFSHNDNPVVVVENGDNISIQGIGLPSPLKIVFAADLHLVEVDARDDEYHDNYKRMAQYRCNADVLFRMVEHAKNADLFVLGGDIISFPSHANIDVLLNSLKSLDKPWIFINGNHDWHFEGVGGTETEICAKWSANRLAPLFQGRNPHMSSMYINGLKLLFIDNSTGEILPEQLEYFRMETADGKPSILMVHIPLYVPGRSVAFACGHPDWNAMHDPYWQIERRPQWPAKGHTQTTMDFCEAVWNTPNLLGVFAGHTHIRSTDFCKGKFQIVAPSGSKGKFLEINMQ